MNMTEKNGQPSMEEILASIRRIIAEEPTQQLNGEFRGTPITLKGDGVLEDAGDFDLPAIFRSSPAPVDRPTPLLGRLTDAIRSATAAQPEGRGHVNGESAAHTAAEPVDGGSLSPEPQQASYQGLSTLQPVRHAEPAYGHQDHQHMNGSSIVSEPEPRAPEAAGSGAFPPAASSSPGEPKRVMTPFKDTHFLRMTPEADGASAATAPVPAAMPVAASVSPEPVSGSPADFGAIIPGQFDHSGMAAAEHAGEPMGDANPREMATTVVAMPPPPLPMSEPGHVTPLGAPHAEEGAGTIEDTTADLLRPMLRQWLADNMPRMVEKALHIEIAESVKGPTRKP